MIHWDPQTRPQEFAPSDEEKPLLARIARLVETLETLEAADPGTDSIGHDTVTDHLIEAARHLAASSRPILEHRALLASVFDDASQALRDRRLWCRACDDEGGRCSQHTAQEERANIYDTLRKQVTGT